MIRFKLIIYTDGCCFPVPNSAGTGGYAAVLRYGESTKEIVGGFLMTNAPRMELYGALTALEALKRPCHVIIRSDSKYLVNMFGQGWARKWKAQGWYLDPRATVPQLAKNVDLVSRLLNMIDSHFSVRFEWVRGHNGDPDNERCDKLAQQGAEEAYEPDPGYQPRQEESDG